MGSFVVISVYRVIEVNRGEESSCFWANSKDGRGFFCVGMKMVRWRG